MSTRRPLLGAKTSATKRLTFHPCSRVKALGYTGWIPQSNPKSEVPFIITQTSARL